MIRPARPGDEPRLRAIQAAALDEPWPELLDVALDGHPVVLVVDLGDGPVAYTLVVPDHPVAYVAELAVTPPLQGQGHGSRLLESLLDQLRNGDYERVRLTCRADDERVRSFYGSFGFTVAEELPGHYEDGDGLVLVREL